MKAEKFTITVEGTYDEPNKTKAEFEKRYGITADWKKGATENVVDWTFTGLFNKVKACIIDNWNFGDYEEISGELMPYYEDAEPEWLKLFAGMNPEEDC